MSNHRYMWSEVERLEREWKRARRIRDLVLLLIGGLGLFLAGWIITTLAFVL